MRGRTQFSHAILLRSVDYGEADRIVTLLTRDEGKVALIARGARRSKKRFGSALEPFALLKVEMAMGRGQLGRLAAARVERAFPTLLGNLERMNAAGLAFELVRTLAPEHSREDALFDVSVEMLEGLSDPRMNPGALLLCFKIRAMVVGGFAPRFDMCGLCGKRPDATQAAMFDPQRGHLVCTDCGGASRQLDGWVRTRLLLAMGDDWQTGALDTWPVEALGHASASVDAFIERASMGA